MKLVTRIWIGVAQMVAIALAMFSCSNEFNRSSSPVDLIVTNIQDFQRIDLAGNGSSGNTNCDKDVGKILVESRPKVLITNVDTRFNDVRVTSYRVSYRRIDGGTAVPAPFVRPMDALIPTGGGATPLSKFIVLTGDAFSQAPFASLLPQNGGRDPQTGRAVVSLEVTIEIFGETLAGSNVSGATRFPLDFCFSCNGCA
jgi:hypothetical protein